MNNDQLLSQILVKHPVFGELCREAEDSYKNYNYSAALACLFLLLEGVLKYALDNEKTDRLGLAATINKSYDNHIVTVEEKEILNQLRRIRNGLFHEDPYSMVIEIEGLLYPYSEADTKELLYELYSIEIFKICARLVNS